MSTSTCPQNAHAMDITASVTNVKSSCLQAQTVRSRLNLPLSSLNNANSKGLGLHETLMHPAQNELCIGDLRAECHFGSDLSSYTLSSLDRYPAGRSSTTDHDVEKLITIYDQVACSCARIGMPRLAHVECTTNAESRRFQSSREG
jgi:hypothetical protein